MTIWGAVTADDIRDGERRLTPGLHPRALRVGRIPRDINLDEPPQILNVLKGHMSLVGSGPNVPWEVEKQKSWHYERFEVLAGITSMAQVWGRSGISFDST